uniref:THAP-type domain-containing protein n=1 Tax=Eptatretus burgeri TaxID=7764 RepID=A0A8C4R720_EPTBU
MGKSCCAPRCTQRYTKGSGVQFYRFPAEVDRQNLWISVLRREKWRLGEHDWLCSLHFVSGIFSQYLFSEISSNPWK